MEDAIVGCIDPIIEELTKATSSHKEPRLLEIGRYFALRAGHREAVKFGLALIGVFGTTDESEILRALGRCEEFTLFTQLHRRIRDNRV